jgi:cytochrome bd-type quinol oxidase subunit 2
MFSVNGLIIMFMFGYMLATIVEAVKQENRAKKKAIKDIEELKNIFPTVWED